MNNLSMDINHQPPQKKINFSLMSVAESLLCHLPSNNTPCLQSLPEIHLQDLPGSKWKNTDPTMLHNYPSIKTTGEIAKMIVIRWVKNSILF